MIEICCGSYRDGMLAWQAGIKRIELNSALSLGGLTPHTATLGMLKRETTLEIICMVRGRGAGFLYDEMMYRQMYEEAEMLLRQGADGLAFGFLTEAGTIDVERTTIFTQLCHMHHKTAVFHRAFDCLLDLDEGIKTLVDCHVDRVLTSGGAATACEGREMLAHLEKEYGSQIEILAGCGIDSTNVALLMSETHISQIHASCKSYFEDATSTQRISFQIYDGDLANCYEGVDVQKVLALKEAIAAYQAASK